MRTFALCIAILLLASVARAQHDDAYLAGYATAVIERDLGLKVLSVEVSHGVARVVVETLAGQPDDRISEVLKRIEGIERVEVTEAGSEAATPAVEPPTENGGGAVKEPNALELLPREELFDPLLADPRQPHFWVAYLWYLDDPDLGHVGSANFGETFALLGGDLGFARWEIGFLGSVFSIFDLDAASYDLVNSDFWAGPTLSAKRGMFSTQVRLFHQSSHLGDEFLLRRPGFNRVNLSYEGVELLFSLKPWSWLRIYAGGGSLVHSEPDLHPLSAQGGIELQSPLAFRGAVRPIAAFDYASREENHWREELSGSAGIQLENPELSRLRVQILVNYYKGNTRNGQFFQRRIETLGLGVHFHF